MHRVSVGWANIIIFILMPASIKAAIQAPRAAEVRWLILSIRREELQSLGHPSLGDLTSQETITFLSQRMQEISSLDRTRQLDVLVDAAKIAKRDATVIALQAIRKGRSPTISTIQQDADLLAYALELSPFLSDSLITDLKKVRDEHVEFQNKIGDRKRLSAKQISERILSKAINAGNFIDNLGGRRVFSDELIRDVHIPAPLLSDFVITPDNRKTVELYTLYYLRLVKLQALPRGPWLTPQIQIIEQSLFQPDVSALLRYPIEHSEARFLQGHTPMQQLLKQIIELREACKDWREIEPELARAAENVLKNRVGPVTYETIRRFYGKFEDITQQAWLLTTERQNERLGIPPVAQVRTVKSAAIKSTLSKIYKNIFIMGACIFEWSLNSVYMSVIDKWMILIAIAATIILLMAKQIPSLWRLWLSEMSDIEVTQFEK